MMFVKQAKVFHLMRCWWRNAFGHTALFLRIIPTDRCNLNCSYCFQKSGDAREMSREEFDSYLAKARELKTGMITFLGGEPMVWPHLNHAIAACTKARIFTDITTNGTLLNGQTIAELGAAGLDLLNISVDVIEPGKVSAKNSIADPEILLALLAAQKRYKMKVRVNAVLYKDNSAAIKELVEYTHGHGLPISIGFVVPHFGATPAEKNDIYFTLDDRALLDEITDYLISRKTQGYKIIDTRQYFRNIYRYLRREKFWECNYQRRFGWLNVTPAGRIRSCTKKMDELDDPFLDLTPRRIKELRGDFRRGMAACNVDCYSNCAYNGYYFFRNLPLIAWRYISGVDRNV